MAKLRNLSSTTIVLHLEKLIQNGCNIDIDRFVDPLKRRKIEELFLELRQWNLNPVIEHFSGTVSYEEARLVRAFLVWGKQRECIVPPFLPAEGYGEMK